MYNLLLKGVLLASVLTLAMPADVMAHDWDRRGPGGPGGDPRYNPHPQPPRYNPPPPPPYRPAPPPYRPDPRPPYRPDPRPPYHPPAPPPHYPPPPPPNYPPPPPPPSYGRDLHAWVGQNYYGRSILPLREMLGIGREYYGYHVESVTVRLRSNNSYGYATLVINGYRESNQRVVDSYLTDYMFFPSQYNDQIGSEIGSLQIELEGDFYVESVSVRLR